ncbi:UPF0182 family protein [Leptolyngbya sp. FACHB-17]|uniref:UPF0182 family protein n=1 Tax=unclassified Leptolyngbya TaxID=2650499 RepID=UPI001680D4D2|nr:UPF0182 family protein [Leptolyngbya sp. FACHB-17]
MLQNTFLKFFTFCLGGWILLSVFAHFGAEIFWFQEVGYLPVFLIKTITQGLLGLIVAGVTIAYFLLNLRTVDRLKHDPLIDEKEARFDTLLSLRLRTLLPLAIVLSLTIGFMLAHYGQLAWRYWQSNFVTTVSLFNLSAIWQIVQHFSTEIWYPAIAFAAAISILIFPQFLLTAIAIVLTLLLSFILSQHWIALLQYLYPTAFNAADPLFNREISFYIFALPIAELLSLWLVGLSLFGLLSVSLSYLLSGNSLSEGRFLGFSSTQQRHLFGVGSLFMFSLAFSYWLSRYELLYSTRGAVYGAGYTDIHVQLPAYVALGITALAIAFYLFWRWIFWRPRSKRRRWVGFGLIVYGVVAIVAIVLPEVVQYLIVQPNELVREQPYIEKSIALTRQAFGLNAIDTQTFNPQGQLSEADLRNNDLTVRNIRLWDQRPLLDTNRELQQIRLYYRFPDADFDRYTLRTEAPTQRPSAPASSPQPAPSQTERRQVLIAARELDYRAVPEQAQTWVNQHLVYTHGYGFTVSPVNVVGAGGLPEYFVKDIGNTNGGALVTSSQAIRDSIPIGRPRIYYGELTDTHVMTGTRQQELDYPSGSDNAYNSYDGKGGLSIGSWWRRSLFAMYLKDWRLLVTREFLPETKVLFRRTIKQRIQAIAPFLRYDSNPYLVAANGNSNASEPNQNYLYWMIDAYAASERYPYSEPTQNQINYIRNSVKVVIDAYNGSVDFYVADPSDPIITTWTKIFPSLFKPLSAMPETLRQHIRYPVDFFKIQSDRLRTYHMTDPQVFYNREDQWTIANEVYGNQSRLVEPYYLITSLPTVPFEEFILLLPYTPQARTNLVAWLAARSDGENYGRLLLYTFPKERLVYGPEQIEARINQDPVISQQISLWNRQGSRAIQGNLLVVPIEQSLLYVEPIYLEAEQNSLPTLVRVVVAYENRIVMTPTLEESLKAIFRPEVTPAPVIIRPVEESPAQTQ